jgi:hypothetical protein
MCVAVASGKAVSPGAALRVGSPSAPLKPVTRTPSQRKLGDNGFGVAGSCFVLIGVVAPQVSPKFVPPRVAQLRWRQVFARIYVRHLPN